MAEERERLKCSSLWHQTASHAKRPALDGERRTQVAVIGAGMAGVLIADRLASCGMEVVVLEAGRIGGGQTSGTTAKITSQHGLIYHALTERLGKERAQQYARANEEAIRAYARMVESRHIDCGFRETFSCLYTQAQAEPLLEEAQTAAQLGIDARFTEDTELPFSVTGAVRFDHQACFHPLQFLLAVSEGLEIYENTRVLGVEGDTLRTPRGTVRAEHVVFAAHYPFVNVPGWYFMRMHQERSYVLALECDFMPDGLYYGVDRSGLSFRTAEGLLLLGGGNHRTGENTRGGSYEALRQSALRLFPGCREVFRWSAQDCMTLDGVPYIGRFSASTPNWYVATGFGKWGMSTSMVAAMCIAGEIVGERPEWAEVFCPARFAPSVSAQKLAQETAHAFKGLTRTAFSIPQKTLDALPVGHGGIVQVQGQKAGVYKDEAGVCHIVSPRCPHLGCELTWNPDEKSWDCPCHGSRFGIDGGVLAGPAQERIGQEE